MSRAWERAKQALIGTLGRWLVDALLATARVEVRDDAAYTRTVAPGRPVVYALWHGRLLPLTWFHRGEGVASLISLSGDGEYIARVVQGWGYRVVRGSTSRGGSRALAEMIRQGRRGRSLAFTPDGPRGPRERMKPGLLLAAQRAGLPVVVVSAACSRAWWFEGWDRFLVPKPFSRIVIAHGAPLEVPPDLDEAGLERLGAEVERALCDLQAGLDAEIANGSGGRIAPVPAQGDGGRTGG